jgi:hypothetical protein
MYIRRLIDQSAERPWNYCENTPRERGGENLQSTHTDAHPHSRIGVSP